MAEMILCPGCAARVDPGCTECPVCHHGMDNKNPGGSLAYGTVLAGRYTIGEFLAADGEGFLYQAVENVGAIRVTIKEYLPITLSEDRAADGSIRPKAGCEVLFKTTRMDYADLYRALQRITPATGLEAVLDVLEANNTVYAVLENPGGIPMTRYLASVQGVINPAEARSMLQPVFEGVAAMHAAGLVHRGVSPENIRVLENGRARLTGYATIGLRTLGGGLRSQLYEGYSAPEQYSSAEFEGRYTDEYGLAAVFYRLVTGLSPVPAGQRLVTDSNPSAHSLEPTVPGYLSGVLELGLKLDPAERIQTVPELMSSLSSPGTARAVLGESKREKQQKRSIKNLLTTMIVLLAALLCLGLWYAVGGKRGTEPPASSVQPSAEPEPQRTVPEFIGMTYSQVQSSTEYASGYLFYITEEYSTDDPAGTIIQQTPQAGAVIEEQTQTIQLVVSKGPEYAVMPNLIGFTQDAATAELTALGIVPQCFVVANDGSYAAGCVVRTSADADAEVQVGSTVTVYIAAARDVVITATPTPDPTAAPTQAPAPEESPAPAQ